MNTQHPYLEKFYGYFRSLMHWDDFDHFCTTLSEKADSKWYIYAVGDKVPEHTASIDQFYSFIESVNQLLHKEHDESYCGIVYADSIENPSFIKFYDPNNLGSSCGSSSHPPPLPGWILSRIAPINLHQAIPQTGNRRRWWQTIFSK